VWENRSGNLEQTDKLTEEQMKRIKRIAMFLVAIVSFMGVSTGTNAQDSNLNSNMSGEQMKSSNMMNNSRMMRRRRMRRRHRRMMRRRHMMMKKSDTMMKKPDMMKNR
jgi:hypothetical protein